MDVNKEVFIYLEDEEATLVKKFIRQLKHDQCVDIMMSGVDGDAVYKLLQNIETGM